MSFLLHNLLHFERLLHALGLDVHAGRMPDVVSALEHIDVAHRTDFYFTLQSLLIHRQQDLATFDEAFRVFWRQPPSEEFSRSRDALGRQYRRGMPRVEEGGNEEPAADPSNAARPAAPERVERTAAMTYSAQEVSRVKDFAQFTEQEVQQAQAMLAALTWDVGMRQTRRWSPARGRALDLRRIVRRNIRYGGEWIALPTRDRRSKRRPLVLLCDVSGSMERYARMLLHFIHSLAGGLDRVEAFLFSTRLTRVTRELKRRGAPDEVPNIPPRIPGWGGGTQIGEALRTFNVRWARRVLGHGPVVLLISDGWDRGEPEMLAREMRRLQRSCRRLIWLNPLLGSPDYQPLTRGMQAALPFVDDFLPVHNLASLEMLAEHLNQLPARRGGRR
ncbi:MAG TPA: VWA domain-containing protein [Vicinamibacterales bacterium]|nr:VWA domain-containing protein [Vicinamibacterales bacterium]